MCYLLLERFEDKTERVKICYNPSDLRAVVICEAINIHNLHGTPMRDAILEAWNWVKKQCKEVDVYI